MTTLFDECSYLLLGEQPDFNNTNTIPTTLFGLSTTTTDNSSSSSSSYNVGGDGSNANDMIVSQEESYNIVLIFNDTILNCISNHYGTLQNIREHNRIELHSWMLIFMGSLVFFMQAGFAMICAGCVRKKNMQHTMFKNLLDVCIAATTFYTVGYAFAYGYDNNNTNPDQKTFIGSHQFFHKGIDTPYEGAYWFYQFTLSATCVTIVSGTIAERCQITAYLVYTILLTTFVYPIIAHMIWSPQGFLSFGLNHIGTSDEGKGTIDFAGSGVLHITGGMAALLATIILGPRSGRFINSRGLILRKPKVFPGSSVALQILGAIVLWFGWFGFNVGSALLLPYRDHVVAVGSRAAVNTALGAGTGACSAMLTNMYHRKEITGQYTFSLNMVMNGTLSGLVAVTAGCGTIEMWAAVVTGTFAGWFYILGSHLLLRYKLDDVVDGIPVHLMNGIWGMISVGLFASPSAMKLAYNTTKHVGFFYGLGRSQLDLTLLGYQILGIIFIIGWTTIIMLPFFALLKYFQLFRSNKLDEVYGLDYVYHGTVTSEAKVEVEEDVAIYQEEEIQRNLPSSSRAEKRIRKGSVASGSVATSDNGKTSSSATSTRDWVVPPVVHEGIEIGS